MIYSKRRKIRRRMQRRAYIIGELRFAVAVVTKDFLPELIAAIALLFGVFVLLPILCGMAAATAM